MRNTSKLRVSCWLALAVLSFGFEGRALAEEPGWVWHGYSQPVPPSDPAFEQSVCLSSQVIPGSPSWEYIGAVGLFDPATKKCETFGAAVGAHQLQVMFELWVNGMFCAWTPYWSNPIPANLYYIAVYNVCSNPPGNQTFELFTRGKVFNEPSNSDLEFGPQSSGEVIGLTQQGSSSSTFGQIPQAAFTANGLDPSLVPDLVGALTREGDVAGYIRKSDLLARDGRNNTSLMEPLSVFDEQGARLVGRMYPGLGFVALDRPTTVQPFEVRTRSVE